MDRSNFLKVLGFGTAGLLIPNTILSRKPIKIYDNYIKGIPHYDYKTVFGLVKKGEPLTLKRELSNLYDSFAIEVYYKDFKLGYVAAYENIVMSNIMDQGVELKALISKVHHQGKSYNDIAMEVYAEVIIANPKVIPNANLESPADDLEDLYRLT
jgi:hypothetical protein